MIVLDTNVVSELMRPQPHDIVVDWIDRQPVSELAMTSVTAAELRLGVALLPPGRRRARLTEQVDTLVNDTFEGAVLPFDVDCTVRYAEVVAARTRSGTPISALDAQIAAICRAHRCSLATRNQSDFANTGLDLHDPWSSSD